MINLIKKAYTRRALIKQEKAQILSFRDFDIDTNENYINMYEEYFKSRRLYGHFGSKSRYMKKYPNHKSFSMLVYVFQVNYCKINLAALFLSFG